MRSVRRLDSVSLLRMDAVEVTAEGWRIYDALAARTGTQRYGNVVEYRPDSEVEASIPSFELRPLTDLHPPSNVDSGTARMLARGAVSSPRWHSDRRHVAVRLAVWDAELIAKFAEAEERGEPMQLSAGYTLDLDETPGVSPDGERYDAVQRNIRINHVAAVPLGRAGTARVLTDAAELVGAWDLGFAQRLDDVPRKAARVFVDVGAWTRRDAADLQTQQHQPKDGYRMKIQMKLDGKIVEVEVADSATPGQIAEAGAKAILAAKNATDAERKDAGDALVKIMVDRAIAEAQSKLDALPPEFMKKKKGAEEEEEDEAKGKKDAADLDLKLAAVRDHARTEARAQAVLGMRYDGADKSIEQMRLDVIERVLGEPKRKRIESLPKADQAGATALAFADALELHEQQAHHDHASDLVEKINRARASNRNDGDSKPSKIATDAREAIDNAGMTRAERAQRKAG